MTKFNQHRAGSFCWIELSTSDDAAARAFYVALFGWSRREVPLQEGFVYSILQKNGNDVGALYRSMPDSPPSNWMSYIAVDNVDEALVRAKELGGNVIAEPMDVGDHGRMAILTDNQGAAFAIWQAKQHIGVGVRDEENTLCWNELQARDMEAAKRFYPPLFGWRMKESDEYTEWHLGENAVGGAMLSSAPAEVPAFWLPYFAVADCDATVEKAQSLGAIVHVPCTDIEHVGRFAVLMDPTGASFAVIRITM